MLCDQGRDGAPGSGDDDPDIRETLATDQAWPAIILASEPVSINCDNNGPLDADTTYVQLGITKHNQTLAAQTGFESSDCSPLCSLQSRCANIIPVYREI